MFAAAANDAPIEVPAPELGEGVVARFRSRFTVDDLLAVAGTPSSREPLVLDLLLARLALIDADGQRMVDPNDDDWFQRAADGVVMSRLARRAGLVAEFVRAFRAAPDGDGDELTEDGVRRVIADLALVMRLSPESIRGWALRDFGDVLASLRQRDDGAEG